MAKIVTDKGIKDCPLCGKPAQLERGAFVYAITCPCSSHVFYGCERSAAKTVERWNKRAGE